MCVISLAAHCLAKSARLSAALRVRSPSRTVKRLTSAGSRCSPMTRAPTSASSSATTRCSGFWSGSSRIVARSPVPSFPRSRRFGSACGPAERADHDAGLRARKASGPSSRRSSSQPGRFTRRQGRANGRPPQRIGPMPAPVVRSYEFWRPRWLFRLNRFSEAAITRVVGISFVAHCRRDRLGVAPMPDQAAACEGGAIRRNRCGRGAPRPTARASTPRPGRRCIGPRGRSRPHAGRRLPSDSGRRFR